MNVAMIGLGKLGLPVALAMQSKGHTVEGFDVNPQALQRAQIAGLPTTFLLEGAIDGAEIIFVAVQTPHDSMYEGITRVPQDRRDFDYSALKECCRRIGEVVKPEQVVAVISTVLPGTMEREIWPLLPCGRVYNPSFIAMGTVERDFLHPEFVLVGVDDPTSADLLTRFYGNCVEAPVVRVSVKDAELIKVAYNTFIGMKLAFANTLLEISHKTGCDVDAVTNTLSKATKRLISPAYLTAGMGDGGACHPRDNIALSWLAESLGLSYDLFGSIMQQREKQADWLADLMCEYDLPKVILGTAYKPGIGMQDGSHALLVKSVLEERGEIVYTHDPYVVGPALMVNGPYVALIGCNHEQFKTYRFPTGSVVLDPWRYILDQEGVTVIRLGEGR